ncbi:hypothetical protein [Spiroplasma sp. AdecLV25b]|uniref:hypothetical protein n=1 Tax=Spiroplasma sp. AdecLV25b TaxID=3027162 RepID=UPI0027DF6DF5|nr:hypothetical protein [Spiroplasma sp. AdecLV25b]
MDKSKNSSHWDWRQKFGLFLIIVAIISIIISLILFGTAFFNNANNKFLGDGFWSLKYYGIINLFNNWNVFDNDAGFNAFISHPFQQVYFGIILLIIIFPICFGIGSILSIRGWWTARI